AQILAKTILYDVNRRKSSALRIKDRYPRLFLLAIASTIGAGQSVHSITGLEPIRFLVDTARTDKQIGTSSSNAASTSAIDKPGFPWLLGFAVEHGAVEKNIQDTVLTLSTSPAAL